MKTSLFMATSVNGMIASSDGAENFLPDENWEEFCRLARRFGNFIIGRKTYEIVRQWHVGYSFDDLVDVNKVIVSRDSKLKVDDGYVVADSPRQTLNCLAEKGHQQALLVGGATLNSAFLKEGLLDEILLNIEPVIVGEGINLFSADDFEIHLELDSVVRLTSGILQLKYVLCSSKSDE